MGKVYAILIGIDDDDIHGCVSDVNAITSVLNKHYNVSTSNIIKITSDTSSSSSSSHTRPIFEQIKFSLNRLIEHDKKEKLSYVWVHVSSHGKQVSHDRSSIFKIGNGKYVSSKFITRELSKLSESCEILMTMDYCHSGYYHQLPYLYETHPKGLSKKYVKLGDELDYVYHPRMYCIASTSNHYSGDVLYKGEDTYGGVFTNAWLDGLKHHKYNVCLPELFKTMENVIKVRNHNQKPRFFSSSKNPYLCSIFKNQDQ